MRRSNVRSGCSPKELKEMIVESKSKPGVSDAERELSEVALQHEAFREGREERLAMVRLGNMLRRMRESAGYTQAQLAQRSGMTQPVISRIEQGFSTHAPTIDTLVRYVHGCNHRLLIGAGASTAGMHPAGVVQEQELAAFIDLRAEL